MKQIGTGRTRKGARPQGHRSGSGRRAMRGENLVAEIVDQITRKQARAIPKEGPHLPTAETCTFCLEKAVAGSAYRLVLKCDSGENSSSDP